jgi:hypothetical protein
MPYRGGGVMRLVIHPVGRSETGVPGRSFRAAWAVLLLVLSTLLVPSAAAASTPAPRSGPMVTRAPGVVPGVAISTEGLPAGAVRLTWSAAPTSAPPVVNYVVGRTGSSTVNPTPYSETVSAGQRSWIFSSLVPGQEYRLWVAAVDAEGAGQASSVTYRYLPPGFTPSVPSAPVMPAVRWVNGTSAQISWLAPDSDGGSPVTGYEVARDGAVYGNPGPYSTVVNAGAFTFRQLIPGRTYTLSVRAVTAAGPGPAVTATYTVPAFGSPQPDTPVFALRLAGDRQTVERVSGSGPLGADGPITDTEIYRNVSFAVDRQGSLYLADATAATVRKYPFDGSAPVDLGGEWGVPTDVNLDARGNVYVLDAELQRAVMVRAADGRRIVFPQDATGADLTVGLDGSVALTAPVEEDGPASVDIETVQALGERPATSRRIQGGQFVQAVAGMDGSIYLELFSGLGAQADFLTRVDPGASVATGVAGPSRITAGNGTTGQVVVSTIRYWCPTPNPSCRPDLAVDALQVFGAGSTPTTVPVTGLTEPDGLAADAAGRLYALNFRSEGSPLGILRVPAAGGEATLIAPGLFFKFAVG